MAVGEIIKFKNYFDGSYLKGKIRVEDTDTDGTELASVITKNASGNNTYVAVFKNREGEWELSDGEFSNLTEAKNYTLAKPEEIAPQVVEAKNIKNVLQLLENSILKEDYEDLVKKTKLALSVVGLSAKKCTFYRPVGNSVKFEYQSTGGSWSLSTLNDLSRTTGAIISFRCISTGIEFTLNY